MDKSKNTTTLQKTLILLLFILSSIYYFFYISQNWWPEVSLVQKTLTRPRPKPQTQNPTLSITSLCQRRSGLISIADGGRLGNQLGEYASLLAASKVINATPVTSEVMRNKLFEVFPYFTIPSLKCSKTKIEWTHIGLNKIQNLTTPISKQTLLIMIVIVYHYTI